MTSLFEVTNTGAAHPVRIRRVVVVNAVSGWVESTHDHKVPLILGFSAEALLTRRQETAVLDWRGTQLTVQDNSVDQDYGHMALLQMGPDLLN